MRSTREAGGRSLTHLVSAGVAGALVALVLGPLGGAIAAVTIGSKQIADDSIRSRDVRDGGLRLRDLDPATRTALSGAPGAPGHDGHDGHDGQDGPAGDPGADGADGVAAVAALVGPVASILPNSGSYVFVGPPAQVTTTADRARLTGSASASLGLNTGSAQFADVGMCRQALSGGVVTNLYGSDFATDYFTTARATYAVAATAVLPPGSYKVGMCIRNNGASTINNNNYVNGWVMVSA